MMRAFLAQAARDILLALIATMVHFKAFETAALFKEKLLSILIT